MVCEPGRSTEFGVKGQARPESVGTAALRTSTELIEDLCDHAVPLRCLAAILGYVGQRTGAILCGQGRQEFDRSRRRKRQEHDSGAKFGGTTIMKRFCKFDFSGCVKAKSLCLFLAVASIGFADTPTKPASVAEQKVKAELLSLPFEF